MDSKIVIGIGGKKHCGKDTFASMLLYINHVGAASANYKTWFENWRESSFMYREIVTHFADSLKDACSTMFHINRKLFDDTSYKDDKYYSFRENKFIDEKDITLEHQRLVDNNFLNFENFASMIANNPDAPLIKLRNLMTVYADTMKYVFGENVFVNSTLNRINEITSAYNFCLVPDVRFINEVIALKQTNDVWQGYIIKIIRKNEISDDNHNSEVCNFNADFTIINDSNLFKLFYKAINVYNKIVQMNNLNNKIKRDLYELNKRT